MPKSSDRVGNENIPEMDKETHPASVYDRKICRARTILFPLLVALSPCTKDSVERTVATGPSESAAFSLTTMGPHQLVLSSLADATDSIIILDWVDMQRPVIKVPNAIEQYRMENNGQDLVLMGRNRPLARFSTRDNPQSSGGEAVYHVNGISKLTDRGGFNAGAKDFRLS